MRVICRACNGLIEEKDAIRMNMLEYESRCEDYPKHVPIDYGERQSRIDTQICEECFNSDWKFETEQFDEEVKNRKR